MKEVIKVSGMMCGHCEKRVENALKELGIKAKADHTLGEVSFEPNEKVSKETVIEEIESLGYDCL